MTDQSENLIPYFSPSLSSILVTAEDEKGSPLDYYEVIEIRDRAACIMLKQEDAEKMDERRGHVDLDPENVWYDWQMLRREMDRKPDIDAGPSFVKIDEASDDYKKTIADAKKSLPEFIAMLPDDGTPLFDAMINVEIIDDDESAYMWLANTRFDGENFIAELFEAPEFFKSVDVGQIYQISPDDIMDWMFNDEGTLYGGFSLRFHRSTLSEEEKKAYDEYIGVKRYV